MKILVISNNYPTLRNPSHGTFVYQLVQKFVDFGHDVTVIRPTYLIPKKFFLKKTDYGSEKAKVYRPCYISTSAKSFLGFNTYHIGEKFQMNCISKTVRDNKIEFDVVYSHFFTNAFIAVGALEQHKKPIYAAIGEYYHIDIRRDYYKSDFYNRTIRKIRGYIAVSPQINDKLVSLGIEPNKILLKPNGVDFSIFYRRNKTEMRKKYNLPLDGKIVIFVGRFHKDKGPKKLLEAVEQLKNVSVIFVGSGDEELISKKIIFKDKVPSSLVPELLSASDLFCLPTLHEGSCNAIVEAMACGLPIVSSNIPEIQVQCDPSFSKLVNPNEAGEIKDAIENIIYFDQKLSSMSKYAIQFSKKFDINERAKSILTFIGESVKYN